MRDTETLGLTICQPSLAKYRLAVYQQLGRRAGVGLRVLYSQDGYVPNVEPVGVHAEFRESRKVLARPELWVHPYFVEGVTRQGPGLRACVLPWNTRFLSLYGAMRRARREHVGVVLWGHGYPAGEGGWKASLRDWTGRGVAGLGKVEGDGDGGTGGGRAGKGAILVYSPRGRERVLARGGYEPERVIVAPNAIDQGPIQRAREMWCAEVRLEEFWEREGLGDVVRGGKDGRGGVLVFVARLEAKRRLDLMLRAMAELRTERPGLTAVVIGDGAERGELERMAGEMGVRVRFVGALYEEEKIAPWMLSADVMCFPSYIGLSILHAFGYGVPVVTSDDPAAHGPEFDALRDGENGRVYRAGDAMDLARVLREMLESRESLQAMAGGALRTATEEYTIERMVDGFITAGRIAAQR